MITVSSESDLFKVTDVPQDLKEKKEYLKKWTLKNVKIGTKLPYPKNNDYSKEYSNYFKEWLKKKNLESYAKVLSKKDAEKIHKKFVEKFIDFSFVKDLREVYGDEELKNLPLDALVRIPGNLNKELTALTEVYWIPGKGNTNELAHRKRVKELILNKKSFTGGKIYWHMQGIDRVCLVDYSNLEKFIDAAEASQEYYIFDESISWCLAVNHEYYIVVCGDLLKKK